MNISEYKHGIELLKNEDNEFWINNVICWQQKEDEYNIYCFSVNVLDDNELRQIYKPITAAIATEFQTILEKSIEKWNIYIVFQSSKSISVELKDEIEQNKYSTRKLVWDSMEVEDMNSAEFINQQLLSLNVKRDKDYSIESDFHLLDKIKEIDSSLYNAVVARADEVETLAAIYLGGKLGE